MNPTDPIIINLDGERELRFPYRATKAIKQRLKGKSFLTGEALQEAMKDEDAMVVLIEEGLKDGSTPMSAAEIEKHLDWSKHVEIAAALMAAAKSANKPVKDILDEDKEVPTPAQS
jgi:hypothetical protein